MKRKYFLSIITLPALIFSSLSFSNIKTAYAENECSAVLDLDRSTNKNTAVVKNNSQFSCEYTVTLALYDSPQAPETFGWIDAQTLIGSDTKKIKPGETVNFFVEDTGKACFRQSDLFQGSNILKPPHYDNNLATDVYEIPCITPSTSPTPTSTSTPIPTTAPTQIPAPTPTSAPGPTSTPGQAASSQSSSQTSTPAPTSSMNQAVLGATGNSSYIYAILLSGAVALISGLILRKLNK